MLLHLSDLHFGTEQEDCLKAIQNFCQTHPIEAIVVSGDLTQRARFMQFYTCKRFLESLNCPYLVVPGNHDIPLYHLWRRVFDPFTFYKTFFGDPEKILETENFFIVGINTIRRRYHTKGYISFQQVKKFQQTLAVAPSNKLKLLVAHQPFCENADCPKQIKYALQYWSQYSIFGILHGHLHKTAVYDLNQIYHLKAPMPLYDILAGTATSHRLRYGLQNSFNVVFPTGEIQHYVFNLQKQDFEYQKSLKR